MEGRLANIWRASKVEEVVQTRDRLATEGTLSTSDLTKAFEEVQAMLILMFPHSIRCLGT